MKQVIWTYARAGLRCSRTFCVGPLTAHGPLLRNIPFQPTSRIRRCIRSVSISPRACRGCIDKALAGRDGEITLLEFFVHVCLRAISVTTDRGNFQTPSVVGLHREALMTLHHILLSPHSLVLAPLHMEHLLIDRLSSSLHWPEAHVQVLLLDVVFAALKLQSMSLHEQALRSPSQDSRRFINQDVPVGPGLVDEIVSPMT